MDITGGIASAIRGPMQLILMGGGLYRSARCRWTAVRDRGPKTLCLLTAERAKPTAIPRDLKVFAPSCLDRESDPLVSDTAGTQASNAPLSCLRGRNSVVD